MLYKSAYRIEFLRYCFLLHPLYAVSLCILFWHADKELKLLRDQLEQLTGKVDAEAKCRIAAARDQVVPLFLMAAVWLHSIDELVANVLWICFWQHAHYF